MAKSFNLTANLVLQGPQNIQPVVASIRRQIGSINASVNLKFDPKSIRNASALTSNIQALSTSINQLTASATSAQSAITALNASFNTFARTNSNVGKGITTTLKNINKTTQAVNQSSASLEKFGKDAAVAIKRFAAYTVATAGIFAFVGAVGKATAEAIDFQHEIVRIGQVTGKSVDQLGGLEKEITRLSTSLGVSSKSLVNVAQILAQAGLSADDTRISLEALAKSTLAPTFKDIENTTEGAIAAMAQFKIRAVDLESVLGSLNSVSAAYAVESEDLVSVIRRAGGVFATASAGLGNFSTESARGVRQLQELSALFTTVRSTTRESAESIATGLRTIFARIERKSTIDYLKQFNIQLEEAGKFVGTFEGFKRISEGLKGLDTRDIRFSAIIEELGGFRQISKVIPLIKNFTTAEDALNVAIGGQESLTRDAVTAQQSLTVQITKTRESFLALVRDIGKSNTFQGIAQGALVFANSMIKLGEILKPVIPLITALAAIKGFKALQQFGSGFFGTLRGIGAVGAGQNIANKAAGPGTNNVVNNAAISAISSLNTNMQANTFALRQLVVSMQTLNKKQFGVPYPTGASSPVKFARGGIVPGSGNRDTVPAMLMPGEFVVRKNAVQAIGAENLFKANGMAKGSSVKDDPDAKYKLAVLEDNRLAKLKTQKRVNLQVPDNTIAGLYFNPVPLGDSIDSSNLEIKSHTSKETLAALSAKYLNKGQELGKITGNIGAFGLGEDARTSFSKEVEPSVVAGLQNAVNKYRTSIGEIPRSKSVGPRTSKQLLENIGGNAILGSLFEGFVSLYTGSVSRDKNSAQRGIDYQLTPGRGEKFKKLFGPGTSSYPFADAKFTRGRDSRESLFEKALNADARGQIKLRPFAKGGSVQGTGLTPNEVEKVEAAIGGHYAVSSDNLGFSPKIVQGILEKLPAGVKTNFVIGPAGSGKSTYTSALGARPLLNPEDAFSASELTFESASGKLDNILGLINRTKATGGRGILLNKSVDTVKAQRLKRVADKAAGLGSSFDKRSEAALAATGHAPTSYDDAFIQSLVAAFPALDIKKLAKGGSAGTDTVPAMLTPGEFVINKKAAGRLGPSALNKLNNADKVQRFARGGSVQHFAKGGVASSITNFGNLNTSNAQKTLDAVQKEFIKVGFSADDAWDELKGISLVFYDIAANGKKVVNVEKTYAALKKQNAAKKAGAGSSSVTSPAQMQANAIAAGALPARAFQAGPNLPPSLSPLPSKPKPPSRLGSLINSARSRFSLLSDEEKNDPKANPIDLANLKANRLQSRIFGASAIAATASQFIPQDTQGGAIAGGAIQGAAGGIGTASALGLTNPIGIAAVAVAAATYGIADSFDNFNKSKALAALEKSTNALGDSFGRLADGVTAVESRQFGVDVTQNAKDITGNINAGKNTAKGALTSGIASLFGAGGIAGLAINKTSELALGKDNFISNTISDPGSVTDAIFGKDNFASDVVRSISPDKIIDRFSKGGVAGVFSSNESVNREVADKGRTEQINAFKTLATQTREGLKSGASSADIGDSGKLALVSQNKVFQNAATIAGKDLLDFAQTVKGQEIIKQEFEKETKTIAIERAAREASIKAINDFNAGINDSVKQLNLLSANIGIGTEDFKSQRAIQKNSTAALRGDGSFRATATRDFGFDARRLDNVSALSRSELKDVTVQAAKGGGPQLEAAAKGVQETQRINSILDETLKSLGNVKSIEEGGDIEGKLRNSLTAQGIDTSSGSRGADLLNIISKQIGANRQLEGGPEGGDIDKLREALNTTRDNLTNQSKAEQDALKANLQRQIALQEDALQAIDDYNAAVSAATDAYINVQKINNDILVKTAEIENKKLSLQSLNQSTDNEFKALTGTSDIGAIAKEFSALQAGLASGLIPETNNTQARLTNLGKALEKAKGGTDKFSNALKVAAEAEQRRDILSGAVKKIVTGNTQDIAGFGQTLGIANAFAAGQKGLINGGNIDVVGQNLDEVKGLIEGLQGKQAAFQFERSFNEEALKARGADPQLISDILASIDEQNKKKLENEQAAIKALEDQKIAVDTLYNSALLLENAAGSLSAAAQARTRGFNSGGIVGGSGPNRDSVFASLTPGEFVVNRNATRENKGLLTAMNSGKKIRGYNNGGVVEGSGGNGGGDMIGRFMSSVSQFSESINRLAQINIPERITIEVAPIQSVVTFSGEGALASEVAVRITQQVEAIVNNIIGKHINVLSGEPRDSIG